jgi:calcineurin-like phosphoesterase
MPVVRVAFLGDIVGKAGRDAFAHALPLLRRDHRADIVIANAENAKHGRGLHEPTYNELINTPAGGPDALTLGDHALDDPGVLCILTQPDSKLCRPWRLDGFDDAKHRRFLFVSPSPRSPLAGKSLPPIAVVTIVCRVFMPKPGGDPFEQAEDAIAAITAQRNDALIIVEAHAEATSEKAALACWCAQHHPGRVVAVVGTHTHCQTNDARLIAGSRDGAIRVAWRAAGETAIDSGPHDAQPLAAMSDLGMTGAAAGVIGFNAHQSISRLRTLTGQFHPETAHPVACGALIDIDTDRRAATAIAPIAISPRSQ